MSKVKLNPVFEKFSSKLGDLVFYKRRGRMFVRRNGEWNYERSQAQKEIFESFTAAVKIWKQFGGIMRQSWEACAHGREYSGYNAFIGANVPLMRRGEPLELFKALNDETLSGFTAAPGQQGQIACSFTPHPLPEGRHITFFTQRIENGRPGSLINRHDGGAGCASPFTISGLEQGASYAVYAVTTDTDYDNATAVSASRGMVATAG